VKGFRKPRKMTVERDAYVSIEEFVALFLSERVCLQRLALLLTADSRLAARCVRLALNQCGANSCVLRGWAFSWARRMVIRNAIDLVMRCRRYLFVETAGNDDRGTTMSQDRELISSTPNGKWILGLPGLDRFVFVICVLERYSVHECAALLGKSLRDVNDSRRRTESESGRCSHSISSEVEVCTL
jgi:hypothetical protein